MKQRTEAYQALEAELDRIREASATAGGAK